MSSTLLLDLRTLAFVLMLVTILIGSTMVFVWRRSKTYPGFELWAIGNLMLAAGFFLLIFRGMLPDFLTVIVGNSLITGSLLLAFEGARRFRGLPDCRIFSLSLLALQVGLLIYFTYADKNEIARIGVVTLLHTIICARAAFEIMRNVTGSMRRIYHLNGLILLSYGIFSAVRFVITLAFSHLTELYAPDWFQSFSFLAAILFAVILAFSYIILNSERMQQELKSAQFDLEKLAMTDFTTGINNKRNFLEIGENEIQRAKRFSYSLSVIMFDIDHFKSVNDSHGHAMGDKVLARLAAVCRGCLRSIDVLGRMGGEEFAVLLPYTNIENAKFAAEHLRSAIEQMEVESVAQKIKVTASFGLSELTAADDRIEIVLERTDALLYEAKRQGRNRVVADTSDNSINLPIV